ncbi:MAG: YitT family protein [Planctomycetota bacterium]
MSLLLLPPWRVTLRRLPQVVFGLWLFGTGIAMMVAADLGLPPWDVFHQGVAATAGVSLGTVIIVTGLVLLVAFVPLRERLGPGTILNAVLIGIAVDTTLGWLQRPDALWVRVALCVAGPAVVGLASGLYIGGGLGPGPRDGIMTGLGRRGFRIWKVRTALELSVLLIGVALGGPIGIGTAWFALSIGPWVQLFLPWFERSPASDPAGD